MNYKQRVVASILLFAFVAMADRVLPKLHAQPPMLEVTIGAKQEVGLPIFWGTEEAILLHQNGSIQVLPVSSIDNHQITSIPFRPSPSMQLKGELQDEFGPDYQVLAASHFLFVVPRQSNTDWPQLFQQMHASLIRFFTTRGIVFQPAEFPLVTVVFRTEQEFHRYAIRENTQLSSSTLGYYSILSNRMVLFDRPSSSSNWFSTHKTIFHEATHQFAFNSGIHQRMSQTPLWVVEGLASLFEAPGFQESGSSDPRDKWNEGRLNTWKHLAAKPEVATELLQAVLQEDRIFDLHPDEGYALAWALTHYLSQREPTKYATYLRHVAALKPYASYPKPQRLADFKRLVQSDLALLTKNIQRSLQGD